MWICFAVQWVGEPWGLLLARWMKNTQAFSALEQYNEEVDICTHVGRYESPSVNGGRSVTREVWAWLRLADFIWPFGRTCATSEGAFVELFIGLKWNSSFVSSYLINFFKIYLFHFDRCQPLPNFSFQTHGNGPRQISYF